MVVEIVSDVHYDRDDDQQAYHELIEGSSMVIEGFYKCSNTLGTLYPEITLPP